MTTPFGWAGQVLQVNLTGRKITKVPSADYGADRFLGGVGLNTKIFWEMGCPQVDALSPENPLIASVGPLTGAVGPFQRGTISTISPQSYPDELFSYSSFGGKWPAQLKYAGYDAVVITGKADKPVCVSISDGDVRIVDAANLWGMDTWSAGQTLSGEKSDAESLCIGPAAENLSRISPIITRTGNTAGEGGFGAVMGSKNLKAIQVKGAGSVRIARPDGLAALVKLMQPQLASRTMFREPACGNPARTGLTAYRSRLAGCYGCPCQCNARYKVPGLGIGSGSCAQWLYGAFDPGDPAPVWEMVALMQKLGFDAWSVEVILSFLYLCRKEGVLTDRDFDDLGIPRSKFLGGLASGHEFITGLLYPMAAGASVFSHGLARAMQHFGEDAREICRSLYTARGYSIHHHETVGGALHWALDTRDTSPSATDENAFTRSPEAAQHFGVTGGKDTLNQPQTRAYKGNERNVAFSTKHQMLRNSLTICEWHSSPTYFLSPPDLDIIKLESRAYSAVTGIDTDAEEMLRTGERIWNLRRAVMVKVKREGRTRDKDVIDDIHFEKETNIANSTPLDFPFKFGARRGGPLDRSQFEAMKDEYYRLVGWDAATGWPTRAKLEELALKDVADGLAAAGKLPAES